MGEQAEDPAAAAAKAASDLQSGAVRAAVLGVNDGLVTNVSLILGVAGAAVDSRFVRLAGLASLLAGSFSMAVGEYVSMRAQVDLMRRLLADEEAALLHDPEGEERKLTAVLRARGLGRALSAAVSRRLLRNEPRAAVEAVARVSLGIDPEELGSPVAAAASSLFTFAGGAILPLSPWFFVAGQKAVYASMGIAAATALTVGGLLGYLSERKPLRWALRQLFIVAVAAAATWGIGRLFQVPVT